uniref:Uncharacterized protein n=1 Tax=Arundo donax TaxID=35708 RepID=A0A0A9HZ13_ARUDO
MICVLLHF